jgi:ABC-2 type transport system permease protein
LLSAELLKLRSVRSPWLLLAASQLLTLVGVGGLIASGADVDLVETWSMAVGHAGLASLLSLVLGIQAVAGEHRHKTITDTYLITPRRDRVILAKLGVYTAVGFAFGVAAALTALIATAGLVTAKGGSFDLLNGEVWRTVVGGIAWNAAFAAIGVGVGALVRNLAGAIAAALAWMALVEGLVGQLIGENLSRWLPLAAGRALDNLTDAAAGFSQPAAGALLACYAAGMAALAVSVTLRRDVS